MKNLVLLSVILLLALVGYFLGKKRSDASVNGKIRALHSLPEYYGLYVSFWCGLPAILVLLVWLVFQSSIITSLVISELPHEMQSLPEERLSLIMNDILNIAQGTFVKERTDEALLMAADHYNRLKSTGFAALFAVLISICLAGLGISSRFIKPDLAARVIVERTIRMLMILCSTIAIFTTIGIVLSVLFEAMRFFQQVAFTDFIFGLHWSPQMAIREDQVGAAGSFGMIPLLAGTLMISAIAMLVAVPSHARCSAYWSYVGNLHVRICS